MGHEKRCGVPLKTGDEYDALTRARRFFRFGPGVRKAVKNACNRRVRRRPVVLEDEPDEGAIGDGWEIPEGEGQR